MASIYQSIEILSKEKGIDPQIVIDAVKDAMLVAARRLALGLIVALAAFLIANPYALLDLSAVRNGISTQASLAGGADPAKLGTTAPPWQRAAVESPELVEEKL